MPTPTLVCNVAKAVSWSEDLFARNDGFRKVAPVSGTKKSKSIIRQTSTTVTHLKGIDKIVLEDCQINAQGADDQMFKKNKGLPQAQPRGLTFIHVKHKLHHVMRGLQKFGDQEDIEGYNLPNAWEKVTHLVFTEKANGENAKVAACRINGRLVWVIASKNVSMAVSDANFKQDLTHRSYDESRFHITRKIGMEWYSIISHLDPVKRAALADYLVDNMVTLVGESFFSDSQHIVDMSCLQEQEKQGLWIQRLQFYVMTDPRPEEEGLTHLTVLKGLELMAEWGLNIVPNVTKVALHSPEQAREEESARSRVNSEGAVVYGLDKEGTVVCVYKYKNIQYVYWRAVREQMRNHATLPRLRARLESVYLEHSDLEGFIKEATEFYSWCQYEATVSKAFPFEKVFAAWYDRFNIFKTVPAAVRSRAVDWMNGAVRHNLHIAFMAIPGMGKSTLARALSELLDIPWVNQDELGGAKGYHGAIKKITNDKACRGIICDKSHHDLKVRRSMIDARARLMTMVYIVIKHPDDEGDSLTNTLKLSRERIVKREFGHLSLFKGNKLDPALSQFEHTWRTLTPEERKEVTLVVEVNALRTPDQQLEYILTKLKEDGLLTMEIPSAKERELALSKSRLYEENLNKKNKLQATTLLFEVVLDSQSQERLKAVIKDKLQPVCPTLTPKTEFHMTLLFLSDNPTQAQRSLDTELKGLLEQTCEMVTTKIAYNDRIAGLVVSGVSPPLPHDTIPHITLAQGTTSHGTLVPAVECGHMIEAKNYKAIDIDSLTLTGSVCREVKKVS
eukprot:Ihof_evm2s671 gene=Ihof_evmTU2s671